MDDSTTNLLVIKVATTPEVTSASVGQHLSEHIKGTEIPFDDASFHDISDLNRIKKIYKIAPPAARKVGKQANGVPSGINQTRNLEVQILGAMALRGAT